MSGFSLAALLACAIGLIVIGFVGLVLGRNLFRIVLALSVAEAGGNLLLILVGFRYGGFAPILEPGRSVAGMVDPIPQAMVLTAIVIGVGVQALALALAVRARNAYGSLDVNVLRQRMEEEVDRDAGTTPAGSRDAPADKLPPLLRREGLRP